MHLYDYPYVGAESLPSRFYQSPQKHYFQTLAPEQHEVAANANVAMHQAIDTLLRAGVLPRWILQNANRFVSSATGAFTAEPPIQTVWDDHQPSDVAPDPQDPNWRWDGTNWVHLAPIAPSVTGYGYR